jgi:hypothetical protein
VKLTISLSDSEYALLQAKAKEDMTCVAALVGQLVGCWCADRRAERRYHADPSHYTARHESDFEEVAG